MVLNPNFEALAENNIYQHNFLQLKDDLREYPLFM